MRLSTGLVFALCLFSLPSFAKSKTEPQIETKDDGTQVYQWPSKGITCLKDPNYTKDLTVKGAASLKTIFTSNVDIEKKVGNAVNYGPTISAVHAEQFNECVSFASGTSTGAEYKLERDALQKVLLSILEKGITDPNVSSKGAGSGTQPDGGILVNPAIKPVPTWKSTADTTKQFQTGDHNCSHNCAGQPTRTNYSFILTADHGTHFTNASIDCLTADGICAFSHVYFTRTSADQSQAISSVDVWSKPTTWQITAKTEICTANCP